MKKLIKGSLLSMDQFENHKIRYQNSKKVPLLS